MSMIGRDEYEFANDVRAAMEERAPKAAWILIGMIAAVVIVGLIWARLATLDEVTSGEGRVIPSSQLQVVQTLEGGIVREILIREGDRVEKDQVIMQIDDTGFASNLGELRQRRYALRAEIARLIAEANDSDRIADDPVLEREAPDTRAAEEEVFLARRSRREQEVSILSEQLIQKEQELMELQARKAKLQATKEPLDREVALTTRMNERGVVPEIELLRLRREAAEMAGEMAMVEAGLPRAESAIVEARNRIDNARAAVRAEARERLVKAKGELAIIEETIKGARDKVARTSLRAPVRGIVNKLNVTTIGAVVRPSEDIVEIVPLDDSLLIEAKIRPQDVAFVRPDQKAAIKLTAYDYAIYGQLDARVERISADTIADERSETFYRVILRTDRNYLEKDGGRLPIIPGMVARVDIQTGEKTVLDYLLKPILKVRHEALRER
jgi:adhesin transport system membrane fusion protein